MAKGRPKGIHSKKIPLDKSIDILILQYLAKHNQKDYSFQEYVNSKTEILGSQSKEASNSQQKVRQKVESQIYYLLHHKVTLFKLLRQKGFKTFEGRDILIEDHTNIDQEEVDIDSKFCKFSVRFYYLTAG
jgi:uncharacterized protein Smg (DUF494 family)